MAAWADHNHFDVLLIGEHHGADDGYTSAPFVVAASLAARTRRIRVRMRAVLLPLHDPVSLAEQLATLDVLTGGRAEVVFGLGYVASEFAMFGLDMGSRVRRLTDGLELLKVALQGAEFNMGGRSGKVTPSPVQKPWPPMYLGGGVPASARRAAQMGLGFAPHMPTEALLAEYKNECGRLGRRVGRIIPNPGHYALFVAEDPDRFWSSLAPHALHNANSYAEMAVGSRGQNTPFSSTIGAGDFERLRATRNCLVLTPGECLDLARANAMADGSLQFVPLLGGLSPVLAWESLELFANDVLPGLIRLGLVGSQDAPRPRTRL
jgi:alkanesulfonate monooxygenase SsuD/methylene tetrahydromethanopterin reductase-like flavin-dependent oxidoreductase (luciferase family)